MKRRSPVITLLGCFAFASLVAAATGACSATQENEFQSSGSGAGGPGGPGSTGTGTGTFQPPDGSSFDGENCGSSTFGNMVPASILVVLDKSGSMSGDDNEPDKWGPTVQALNAMMNAADPELNMGLIPFPGGEFDYDLQALCFFNQGIDPSCPDLIHDGGCTDVPAAPVVDVGPLSATRPAISSWLAANDPNGNTPTLVALQRAYEIMRNVDALGERFVLLMTDGAPTVNSPVLPNANVPCKTQADIEAEALAAAAGGPAVKTFVIGSPGSEGAAGFLSQLAINGQTQRSPTCSAAAEDCHYQIGSANYQAELEAALNEISGKVSDCVFEIPQGTEGVDPTKVNVVVETSSGKIEIYRDPTHMNGWDYTDSTNTKIRLYGAACEAYQAEEAAQVAIILGCETVVK